MDTKARCINCHNGVALSDMKLAKIRPKSSHLLQKLHLSKEGMEALYAFLKAL